MSEQKSCLGCTHRNLGCHTECKIYAAFLANIAKGKAEKQEAISEGKEYESYRAAFRRRVRAAHRKHHR